MSSETNEFRKQGKEMVDNIARYIDTIEERPPLAQVEPGYLSKLIPNAAPQKPDKWEDIMKDVEKVIMPGVSHWQSPNFHSYYEAGHSCPSILGDMLSDGIGCLGFSWIASPACTELETIVVDWLGKAIGLPEEFLTEGSGKGGGVIQGSASEATLFSLLAAKMKTIRQVLEREPDKDQYDVLPKMIAYTSDQAHASVERAALMGSIRMRILPSDDQHAMRGDTLKKIIEEDKAKGLLPFFVCATLGTTGCCSFDNLQELGEICEKENIWMHVDAAYAGTAFLCPEFRYLLKGVNYATSFNFNPHKMMRVNFDCSALWVKDEDDLVHAFYIDPTYLKHKHQGAVKDFRHWQIPFGRRFRSLKLWFVLRMFGIEQLQSHVRKQVQLAHDFEKLVLSDSRFEIVNRIVLGLVCIRLKESDELNNALLEKINASGKIHMLSSDLKGKAVLRFAICGASTENKHIQYAWNVIRSIADNLLSTQ
ncbi:aromatic-L-amino-acid decarboxylase-like [Antedon mediterranea]|uniref:aromatic-L-amino-acid decarboxylase-like n=1 Tax=Antedon mediterranea TaxID=105859 RepID=UPI003AF7FBE8